MVGSSYRIRVRIRRRPPNLERSIMGTQMVKWDLISLKGSSAKLPTTMGAKKAATDRVRLAVLQPTGEVFVNGLASAYEEDFPDDSDNSVAAHMTHEEFQKAITKINDALQDHWPCLPCTSFAYGCCICTLGLSFYCATAQVREAEERVNLQIRRINAQENFQKRQIEWRLERVWYRRTSYIEISVPKDAPLPVLPVSADAESVGHVAGQTRTSIQRSAPATEVMEGRTAI